LDRGAIHDIRVIRCTQGAPRAEGDSGLWNVEPAA
jgi:hypothetical protein